MGSALATLPRAETVWNVGDAEPSPPEAAAVLPDREEAFGAGVATVSGNRADRWNDAGPPARWRLTNAIKKVMAINAAVHVFHPHLRRGLLPMYDGATLDSPR